MLIIVNVILDLLLFRHRGREKMGEREIEVFRVRGENPAIISITLVLYISMPKK